MYNAVKKTNNLSVSRPPWDLSACAEHAPVLAQQHRSLQAGRCVSHTQDQKTLSGFTTHLPAPSVPAWQRAAAEVEQWPTQPSYLKTGGNGYSQQETNTFVPKERCTQVTSPNVTFKSPFILRVVLWRCYFWLAFCLISVVPQTKSST